MKKYLTLLFLSICLLIGGIFRSINFTENPVSLNIDEVSFGYNAYSISQTLRDENGVFLPLSFRSTGDYKNPVPTYLMVLPVKLFGLNEFSVRLQNVVIGTLSILVFYFLFLSLTQNRRIALVGAFLSSISAWHIYFSRYAYEGLIATTLISLAVIFLLKIFQSKIYPIFLSALLFTLSMYTYYTPRIFVPILIISFLLINYKKLKAHYKKILLFFFLCFIFALPLVYNSIFGQDSARLKMVFIGNDVEFVRNVALDNLYYQQDLPPNLSSLNPLTFITNENLLLFFFWIQRYLNYFDPGFLFFNGLNMTLPATIGLGLLYLFELPFLVIGLFEILKGKVRNGGFILAWIVLAFFPASITNNEFNAGRALIAIPALLLVISIGVNIFLSFVKKYKSVSLRTTIFLTCGLIIIFSLIHVFIIFKVHYPYTRGEDFMEGTKESILYALQNQDKYQEIILDPYRGVRAGDVYNIPDVYLLFYSKFDPAAFQRIKADYPKTGTKIGKFTVRKIYWPEDRNLPNRLFIGSPWSLTLSDIKEDQIMQKFYLTNGELALLAVQTDP